MRHVASFVGILLVTSALPFAAAGPLPAEVSIVAPSFALVGAPTTFTGSYHFLSAPLPANDVRLYVDGARVGSDASVLGAWSVATSFPARGPYAVHAVADESRLTEATSDVVTVVAAEPPGAPRELVVTPVSGSMRVLATWAAPLDDGGAPVTSYDVLRRDTPTGSWVRVAGVPAASLSATLSVAHGAHVFRVVALNAVGTSAPVEAAITGEPPASPTLLATPIHMSDGVRVDVAGTGGATQQILVERSGDGASWATVGTVAGAVGSITDRVAIGAQPLYRATARNVVASSAPTVAGVSGAPPGIAGPVDVTVEFDHLRIAWSAPASGGALQGYVIREDDQFLDAVPASRTSITWSRTTPGTHVYSVVATSAAGNAAAATDTLTLAQASAPALTGALFETDFGGRVELSWSASVDDGGAPILGYAVLRTPGEHHGARSSIAWVEPGEPFELASEDLRAGVTYLFEVAAYTLAGEGLASTFEVTVPDIDWDHTHALSHFRACEGSVCTDVPANGTYHRAGTGAVAYGPVYEGLVTRNGVPFEGANVWVTIWEESDPEMEMAESNTATTDANGEYTTAWSRPTSITPTSCTPIGFYSALGAGGIGTLERFTICP